MKVTRLSLFRVPALLAACAIVSLSPASAETFTGKIRFKGEIQNEAKPGSLSFTYTGELRSKTTGDRASVSGGGLFRSVNGQIDNTTFRGELTTYTRFNTNASGPGRLIKKTRTVGVSVRGKIIRFPGAVVRLRRPVDGTIDARQRIRGTGTLKVRR